MKSCTHCGYYRQTRRRRLWQRFIAKFRGPQGFQGPTGSAGRDGHLQLSGFPDGTRIHLYNDSGVLLWWGEMKRGNQ